jgi:hypothetical protein
MRGGEHQLFTPKSRPRYVWVSREALQHLLRWPGEAIPQAAYSNPSTRMPEKDFATAII